MTRATLQEIRRELGALRSLRVEGELALRRLSAVEAIAIVGATCAGKSTLVEAVRRSAAFTEGRVQIPKRYITRPARQNESPRENLHVSTEEFEEAIRRGELGLHWARRMEAGREERYGFRALSPGRLAVLSGNNALCLNAASVRPKGALARALFVGVHAPTGLRAERLRRRSPDLWAHRPDEVAFRLGEDSDSVLRHVDLVIENHGPLEESASQDLVRLVELVAELARRRRPAHGLRAGDERFAG